MLLGLLPMRCCLSATVGWQVALLLGRAYLRQAGKDSTREAVGKQVAGGKTGGKGKMLRGEGEFRACLPASYGVPTS